MSYHGEYSDEEFFAPARPSASTDLDALVRDLNPEQRHAVEHRGGPLVVIAGAGSGKTRVLTRRIAHLLATGEARPSEILAITFTNKAADEMRRRVIDLVGPAAAKMWVSTFHSACLRLLRANGDRLGYTPSFTVYDDLDSRRLIELVEADHGIDTKKFPARGVAAVIGQAKAELEDLTQFASRVGDSYNPFLEKVAEIYADYQRRLVAANAMDFDDLLMNTVVLLRRHPDVLAATRQRFGFVLVDEYQDTNRAQHQIVALIAGEHGNVTVVGDADQSVYRWRGADITNIMEFEESFPGAETILLEQNYRSTQTILDAANAVISNNLTRRPKKLFTEGEPGPPICRYAADDERDEAAFVAAETGRLVRIEGLDYGQMAIFYRTNAQSRVIEEELVQRMIPYKVIGGTRYYDRREIKDILSYLRVLDNPADEISLRRIINLPRRGIGDASVAKLSLFALDNGYTLRAALAHAERAGISGKAMKGCASLDALFAELGALVDDIPLDELVAMVAERSGYLGELAAERTHEADGRIENVAELSSVAGEYESLADLLSTVALVADSDDLDTDGTRISLMTLHTAKGLEYDAVFMVGMEEGIFPHARTNGEPDELEEERRLCYVGITRSKQFLSVSHAWSRNLWGRSMMAAPSRFLGEIPAHLVREPGVAPTRRRRSEGVEEPGGGRVFGTGAPPLAAAPSSGAELLGLVPGDRVAHARWGDGVVVSIAGSGARTQARVRFSTVGDKNLLLAAAPITRAGG